MIFNNLEYIRNINIQENIMKALNYATDNNLKSLECGTYKIDGDRLFFNRVSYTTKPIKEGFWEGHKKYIDLHIILSGSERIDYNLKNSLTENSFDKESDFVSFNGEKKMSLCLNKIDFVIFFPEDIHKTGLNVGNSQKVEKVIFKIEI